jgi:Xaa-Pro aminopeptidase
MKTDLDALMEAQDLDALLVTGSGQHNPAMVYMTGGAHMNNAILVKRRAQEPLLFCNAMEREEAASTGLETRNLGKYNFQELIQEANGDRNRANAALYEQLFSDIGLTSGRVGLYGRGEVGPAYALYTALAAALPEITFVGESGVPVLSRARATKDEAEIARIRRVGEATTKVVGLVAGFLTSHRAKDGVLVLDSGEPLTVGEIKRRINLWLALEGLENPEGTIFAIGRDAGIPHSTGNPDDALRLGQTIVFDIFPCESGGGYFHDFTRTWCLGYAPDDVQALYDDVLQVYEQIMRELEVNALCMQYQERTCELFEAQGHATVRSHPQTHEGYVHSLGHGLGLQVHEPPWFGAGAGDEDRLYPGAVVTIEPGLYYPERGMGVRLEDTVWVRPDGQMEVLADYPLDLVLPVEST